MTKRVIWHSKNPKYSLGIVSMVKSLEDLGDDDIALDNTTVLQGTTKSTRKMSQEFQNLNMTYLLKRTDSRIRLSSKIRIIHCRT